MPISDFTSKLLELEDVIISDLKTTNTEVHVFFFLKRKAHSCPHCGSPTEKIHVVDKFHVARYVTWALENVRKRIQKQLHPSKRKYFKRSRKLLLTHQNKLNEESLQALEIMLRQSPDLATAYHLKELFYDFMASKDKLEALPKLKHFILAAQASQLTEFNACLTMLGNWSKYILNAFGYRNFENFRNRIFLSLT